MNGQAAQVIESERARVDREAGRLRAAGHYCSPDSECRITAATAAALLGVSVKTLSNWHSTDRRGPRRLCRGPGAQAMYRLGDVLAYRDELDAAADD